MTSKCGKNKKVAHEAIAECVTDVLHTEIKKNLLTLVHANSTALRFVCLISRLRIRMFLNEAKENEIIK